MLVVEHSFNIERFNVRKGFHWLSMGLVAALIDNCCCLCAFEQVLALLLLAYLLWRFLVRASILKDLDLHSGSLVNDLDGLRTRWFILDLDLHVGFVLLSCSIRHWGSSFVLFPGTFLRIHAKLTALRNLVDYDCFVFSTASRLNLRAPNGLLLRVLDWDFGWAVVPSFCLNMILNRSIFLKRFHGCHPSLRFSLQSFNRVIFFFCILSRCTEISTNDGRAKHLCCVNYFGLLRVLLRLRLDEACLLCSRVVFHGHLRWAHSNNLGSGRQWRWLNGCDFAFFEKNSCFFIACRRSIRSRCYWLSLWLALRGS